jgi:hypothetical protein
MKIIKATVLLTRAADKVVLKTELPCPYAKAFAPEQTPLELQFDATIDTGVGYCRRVLGIEPKFINARQLK